jgi:hypothetical protein
MSAVILPWACAGPPLAGRTLEVDRIEGEVATVIDHHSGEVLDIPRGRLPPGAQEGQVVVDGQVDLALTAQLRAEVARERQALRRVARGAAGQQGGAQDAEPAGSAEAGR